MRANVQVEVRLLRDIFSLMGKRIINTSCSLKVRNANTKVELKVMVASLGNS